MTGYLWLCERCDGRGMLIEAWDVEGHYSYKMAWPPTSPVTIVPFKGKAPVICRCAECKGRGYWEP